MKAGNRLKVFRVVDVPLEEVSGICLRRGPGGELSLVAIGDRVAVAAWFVQPTDDMGVARLAAPPTSLVWRARTCRRTTPSVEAVCADGAGRVVLLHWRPGLRHRVRYLMAGGLGVMRLVDDSRVSLTDLNHQVLFRERDLGKAKASMAERRLKELNPFVTVESHVKALSEHNVFRLAASCDLLIDASNNAGVGSLLNLVAAKQQIPLVHAWVWAMTGLLTTFWPGCGPCLACAFIQTPSNSTPALLGPLPGIMGALQALEVLRILGGLGPALLGRVLIFKGDQFKFTEKPSGPNPHCPICSA